MSGFLNQNYGEILSLAAACIWAIDNQLPKLADDHRRARWLAEQLSAISGVRIISDPPSTNIVVIDITDSGRDVDNVLGILKERSVLLVPFGPNRIRAVTHLDVNDDDVAIAARELAKVLKS